MLARSLALTLVSLLIAGCSAAPTRTAVTPPVDLPRVSVMTYNLNFGIAGDQDTIGVVSHENADVVFFQEANDAWAASLKRRLSAAYPYAEFKADDIYAAGLGVMSKWPIESIEYLPKVNWFPAARVVIATPIGRLQVLNLHLRPPVSKSGSVIAGHFTTPPIREAEVQEFTKALDPSLPTLIVGDFNENEYGRASTWLTSQGYRSALPEFNPKAYTWRWKTSVMTLKGSYDRLCYDRRLVPLDTNVRNAGWSDHLPVVGVFALAGNISPSPR